MVCNQRTVAIRSWLIMTPTLGYEDDIEISKVELARIQLVEAIKLFIEGNSVCAITLAGASELILAGVLDGLGFKTVVEDSTEAIDAIRGIKSANGSVLDPMHGKSDKAIYNEWNEARNHLKHHNKNEFSTIKLNLFDEAYWMIKRALVNAKKANVSIKNEQEFENWIIVNINL